MPKERPAADLLVHKHVLHENDSTVEAHRELVEHLNVLQDVVVRVTVKNKKEQLCIKQMPIYSDLNNLFELVFLILAINFHYLCCSINFSSGECNFIL